MKTEEIGQMTGQLKCRVCKAEFKPIVDGQKFCSGTCCRAVRDFEELSKIYTVLDNLHLRAYEVQMEKLKQ